MNVDLEMVPDTARDIDLLRLQTLHSGSGPNATIVCFPCAGGNAALYSGLAASLAAAGLARTIGALECLPSAARLPTDRAALDARILRSSEVLAERTEGPIIVVGHSFGGYLAHQVAVRLRAAGRTVPAIVVVASVPPSALDWLERKAADDEHASAFVDGLAGVPQSVRRSELFTKVYLPFIRYELKLFAAGNGRPFERFEGPALVVGTATDEPATPERLHDWARWASPVRQVSIEGDHFFLNKRPEALATMMAAFMAELNIGGGTHVDT